VIKCFPLLCCLVVAGCSIGGSGDWRYNAERYSTADVKTDVTTPRSHEADDVALTVATYNLNKLSDPKRLREDIASVAADVWFFQELRLPPSRGNDIPAAVKDLLPAGAWNVLVVRVNRVYTLDEDDEAQAIVTRLPITRCEVWPLGRNESKRERRRCAVAAWTRWGRRELLLVNTDHAPGYFALASGGGHEPHLHALIDRLAHVTDTPILVGGDFNTCGNFWRLRSSSADANAAHRFMRTAGFTPALDSTEPTLFAGVVRGRTDDLYTRALDTSEPLVHLAARGSDHRPLACRIRCIEP